MDYSAANTALWNILIQFGILAAAIIVANILRRKIPFFRKSLMPTAVLAGFILLILRSVGIVKLDGAMMETITYHGIAIGFIAMSLRVQKKDASDRSSALIGAKSGAAPSRRPPPHSLWKRPFARPSGVERASGVAGDTRSTRNPVVSAMVSTDIPFSER